MGQVYGSVSQHVRRRPPDRTMEKESVTACPICYVCRMVQLVMEKNEILEVEVHGTTLMGKTCVWESCWSYFHDSVIKGKVESCRRLLTPVTCSTPMCLGVLSPVYRLRQLDSIAFSKLRTTSLHIAALYRHPDLVRLLLEHGSEPTVMDGFGRAPAAVLLEHWPRVSVSPSRHPPTPTTPDRLGNSDTLLCSSQDTDTQTSPAASSRGKEMELFRQQVTTWRAKSAQCLTLLLRHGLDLNDVADRRRASTLLHIAARYDLADVTEMILNADMQSGSEHGSGVCPCGKRGSGVCNSFSTIRLDHNTGRPERSAFHQQDTLALPRRVKRRVVRYIRSLVVRSHDCVVHCKFLQNRTSTMCEQRRSAASCHCRHTCERTNSARERLASSESREHVRAEKDARGSTGTRARVDLEVRNGTSKTPLAVAVDRGSLNAAHCLLSHGADVFTVDFYGRSILHLLSERDITFDLLMHDVVRQGVDIHWVDNGGNTALHVAAYMGNVSKVRFLLDIGASPDRINLAGKTPLFLAFQRIDPSVREIIMLFMLSSAQLLVRDRMNRLPNLLQREENAPSASRLEYLQTTCDSLLRRCVLTVRRSIGLSRLLDMADLCCLPCPVIVQQALHGQEERSIVDMLRLMGSQYVSNSFALHHINRTLHKGAISDRCLKAYPKSLRVDEVLKCVRREENAADASRLQHLKTTCDTLLRCCVLTVRRSIGLSRLLDMADLCCLPCPVIVQQALHGQEERSIVDMLKLMVSQDIGNPLALHHIDWALHKGVISDRYLKACLQLLRTSNVLQCVRVCISSIFTGM